ncbi:MAG: hypothetical protein Q8R92_06305 [Deltaproteobacteria bacterium]|nr:hypothetical protein [Deltaproteobacteria bacterium]
MTPTDLRAARHRLGLSTAGFAHLVNVADGRTVRRWEAGDRDIPGPVIVLVEALLANAAVRRYFHIAINP